MNRFFSLVFVSAAVMLFSSGCSAEGNVSLYPQNNLPVCDFTYTVVPETFAMTVTSQDVSAFAALPGTPKRVQDLVQTDVSTSWSYPDQHIKVTIEKKGEYLDVRLTETGSGFSQFTWPQVAAENYTLPLHEGKYIPSNDPAWNDFLNDSVYNGLESLSMQFFALNHKEFSVLFVITNPYNNTLNFRSENGLQFSFTHEFPAVNPERTYGFRIYVTRNETADIAKVYRSYIVEKGNFRTLAEKIKDNPNTAKLLGAPHVYFWDRSVIAEDDINWKQLRKSFSPKLKEHIQTLLRRLPEGGDIATAFDELVNLDYTAQYTKNRIIKGFTEVAQMRNLYDPAVFTAPDAEARDLLKKGIASLNETELILLNKHLLASVLGEALAPVATWAASRTTAVLEEIYAAGINSLWIGLDDWTEGYLNPSFVKRATELGYLVAPYDSYHSIHKNGQEQWITAAFEDSSLYEDATVTLRNGKKAQGFQGQGRKLNPVLAHDAVAERTARILANSTGYNSWFIDCDATGEVYDDYSPAHITTQAQDVAARLERMAWIRDKKNMVIGSEGGNDYAAPVIAFAHGIETPAFAWVDPDMSKNKDSMYYTGKYYSPTGGVPEVFAKQVPVKDIYKTIFLDPAYNLPLFRLVYNDSVITTYHWLWGSLKIAGEEKRRMLTEILYNTPPLYHLDSVEWEKHRDTIIPHVAVWSDFSRKASEREMTDFRVLSADRMLQTAEYGSDLSVIVNYSNIPVTLSGGTIIPPLSLVIRSEGSETIYTPAL